VAGPQAVSDEDNRAGILDAARRAGAEFATRWARRLAIATIAGTAYYGDIVSAFREGLTARSPDQLEFDEWWRGFRGGMPDATAAEQLNSAIAEHAWLAARGIRKPE
jgi:hypothetical protein